MLSDLKGLRGLRFRPRWWAFVVALAAFCATLLLGNWQTRRATEKRDLAERFEQASHAVPTPVAGQPVPAEALVFKRLAATGEFVPRYTVLLDNKVYKGRPGYFVVTPLHLSGGGIHVLVNRGWIAAGVRREDIPLVKTPAGEVTVEGLGLARAPRVLGAGDGLPKGPVWPGLTYEDYARWSGLTLQPVFLEQHSDLGDGLLRDWPRPDFGIATHESYAMQWYLIGALSLVLFVSLSFQRDRPPAG